MSKEQVIIDAQFTPKIKTYVLLRIFFLIAMTVIGIPLAIIWLCGPGQYYGKRYFKSIECDLTSKHLRFKKGVLFRVEQTIPLENIQNLTFIENPLLKWLELRVLKIETAGQSNPNGSDMKLVGIVDASDFKDRVLAQRAMLQKGNSSNDFNNENNDKIERLLTDIHHTLIEIKNQRT